jgi:cytochrome c biogenesis protein CcdA
MSWYKVTMPMTDWEPNKRGQELINSFGSMLIANGGPIDAAMFFQKSDDRSEVSFYFSPHAVDIARTLISAYGAIPCSAPFFGTVNVAVGDARAVELLPLLSRQNN